MRRACQQSGPHPAPVGGSTRLTDMPAPLSAAFSSVSETPHASHWKVHNSGSAPMPGIERTKRIGLPQAGQISVGFGRSWIMARLCPTAQPRRVDLNQPSRVTFGWNRALR